MKTTKVPPVLPKTYDSLVKLHLPRPIRDEIDYNNVVEIVDKLAVAPRLNEDQEDYLEMLSGLVETYDNDHLSSSRLTGVELLRALLEEHGMCVEDLADLLEVDRATAYKIKAGTRSLTVSHISKISDRFRVSADALIQRQKSE